MPSSRFAVVAVALTLAACGSSGSNDVTRTSSSAGGSSGAGGGMGGAGAGTGGSPSTTGGAAGMSAAGAGGGAGASGASGAGMSGAGGASAGAAGAAGMAGAAGGCSIPSMCQKTSCCGGPTGSCDFSACQWGCPATMLCPNLMVIPGGGPPGGPTPDPAIVACVMNALRDGTEGAISWSQLGPTPGGSYGENLHILPARKALREASQQNDLAPATYLRDGPSPLGDAAMFDACATSTNSSVILGCLQKAVAGCGP